MARAFRKGEEALQIMWMSKGYYFDLIPAEYFERPCKNKLISHSMYYDTNDSKMYAVKAALTVRGLIAIFDYIGIKNENDVDEGKAIILFTSKSRKEVKQIDWENTDGEIIEYAAKSSWDLIEEVEEGQRYLAEAKRLRRNVELVEKRKSIDKYTCQACGYLMKVESKYIIDCHHLEPISLTNGERITTIDDLTTLCPNCHRIAHARKPPLTLIEIKKCQQKHPVDAPKARAADAKR